MQETIQKINMIKEVSDRFNADENNPNVHVSVQVQMRYQRINALKKKNLALPVQVLLRESGDRFFKLTVSPYFATFFSTQQPQALQEVSHAQNCQVYPR